MIIKKVIIALGIVLLYSSANAMQDGQGYVRNLCQNINSLDRHISDRAFDHADFSITHAQNMLQLLKDQIQPELTRRQQERECYTVSPVIDAFLDQLSTKFEELRATLRMIQNYDEAIDGNGNSPRARFNGLKLDAKIALGKFFRIISQQPFNRGRQTPTFEQCLQATSLTKKWELACIAGSCYNRWFSQAQPVTASVQDAPAPGNVQQLPGQENMIAWRNFLMDLYMQWLIKLENINLLINNLADYLAPDAHVAQAPSRIDRYVAAAQQHLNQGQQTTATLAAQIPQIQERVAGDLGHLATLGHQIQGSLQQTNELLDQISQQTHLVGNALNQAEGVLTDDTIELVSGLTRYARTPYRAIGSDVVGGIGGRLRELLALNPLGMPDPDDIAPENFCYHRQPAASANGSAQPAQAEQQTDQEQPLDENRLRTTLQGVRTSLHGISQLMRTLNVAQLAQQPIATANRLIANDLIDAPEQLQQLIPTYLGDQHLNVAERLQGVARLCVALGTYAQLLHNTILHPYTRNERLGAPNFREWLEGIADTGNQEINPAPAPAAAQ